MRKVTWQAEMVAVVPPLLALASGDTTSACDRACGPGQRSPPSLLTTLAPAPSLPLTHHPHSCQSRCLELSPCLQRTPFKTQPRHPLLQEVFLACRLAQVTWDFLPLCGANSLYTLVSPHPIRPAFEFLEDRDGTRVHLAQPNMGQNRGLTCAPG